PTPPPLCCPAPLRFSLCSGGERPPLLPQTPPPACGARSVYGHIHHSYRARVRVTNLVLMPIFWAARRKPSRAVGSSTPSISYMIRPGFPTATQNSGVPLPLPNRVSARFLVTCFSAKQPM